jgi:hypothetical protein
MTYICQWCSKSDFTSGRSFGAHKTNCKLNPNRSKIIEKNSITKTKDREIISTACENCSSLFTYNRIVNSRRVVRFCSRSCSNVRKHSKETKEKISISLTKPLALKNLVCEYCNHTFQSNRFRKTCSKSCSIEQSRPKISKSNKGKTGGWRNFGGNGMKGTYEGIMYQSSWELAWIAYHLDHKINFRRCTEFFEYEYEGKKSKYYPDFFLEDEQTYVEIKGFMTARVESKIQSVKGKIVVIEKNKIQIFLSYAKAKGLFLT